LNASILFMLSMVVLLVVGFGAVVWRSYRLDSARRAQGGGFRPEGKLRW
jgi:hypothetical protein